MVGLDVTENAFRIIWLLLVLDCLSLVDVSCPSVPSFIAMDPTLFPFSLPPYSWCTAISLLPTHGHVWNNNSTPFHGPSFCQRALRQDLGVNGMDPPLFFKIPFFFSLNLPIPLRTDHGLIAIVSCPLDRAGSHFAFSKPNYWAFF